MNYYRFSIYHHVMCALVVVAAMYVYLFCAHQYLESHPVFANILMVSSILLPMQIYLGMQGMHASYHVPMH